MDLIYFRGILPWLNILSIWIILAPILTTLLTGNWRKMYGITLILALLPLFAIALWENGHIPLKGTVINPVFGVICLLLHTLYAIFFQIHFNAPERKKDARLVIYILIAGIVLLFALIGMKTVIFFIVNMALSIVLIIFGISAFRNLLQEYSVGNRAYGGRLLMACSLLVQRVFLMALYGLSYFTVPPHDAFTISFQSCMALCAISISIGLFKDAGFDPENMDDDDGPYQKLQMPGK